MNKKMFFLILAVFILRMYPCHAQVAIGLKGGSQEVEIDPHEGALLDLQSNDNRGLLLPNVLLTSATVWLPVAGTATDGMMVYNTSTSTSNGLTGLGTYIWSASKWSKITGAASNPNLMGGPNDWVNINPTPNTGDGSYLNPYRNACPGGTTVALSPVDGYTLSKITPASSASLFGNVLTFTSTGTVLITKDGQVGTVHVMIGSCATLLTSISITSAGGATAVTSGSTLQLTSSTLPTDATNKNATWSVTPGTGTATISSNGLVTGGNAGTVTVRATAADGSGKFMDFPLTINPIPFQISGYDQNNLTATGTAYRYYVPSNSTGSITVNATGNGTLSYQWYYYLYAGSDQSATLIPGATSSTLSLSAGTDTTGKLVVPNFRCPTSMLRYVYCVITQPSNGATLKSETYIFTGPIDCP